MQGHSARGIRHVKADLYGGQVEGPAVLTHTFGYGEAEGVLLARILDKYPIKYDFYDKQNILIIQ